MSQSEILEKLFKYKIEHQDEFMLTKIGIFGSVAKNLDTPSSDIDIVVELSKPDLFVLGNIKSDLEKEFGKSVDIVRLRENMNHFLRNRILNDVIYV